MDLFGVVNASPDSLHRSSIVANADEALERGRQLLRDGANALDVGGQGSTDAATVVPPDVEWSRLRDIIPALAGLGVPLSVDTWRPGVARRALEAGATVLNAADGMQSDAMWDVAAAFDVPIVIPFLSGPDPRRMAIVDRNPLEALVSFFEQRLAVAATFGLRERCIIDPGTGFAPPHWPWAERFRYQRVIYSKLDELRRWGLPLYVALPRAETAQHDELLDIVLAKRPDFGRTHEPARIRRIERTRALDGVGAVGGGRPSTSSRSDLSHRGLPG